MILYLLAGGEIDLDPKSIHTVTALSKGSRVSTITPDGQPGDSYDVYESASRVRHMIQSEVQ